MVLMLSRSEQGNLQARPQLEEIDRGTGTILTVKPAFLQLLSKLMAIWVVSKVAIQSIRSSTPPRFRRKGMKNRIIRRFGNYT
jgi:hypothetical protein